MIRRKTKIKKKSSSKLPKKEDQYAWLAKLKKIKYYDHNNKVQTHIFYNDDPWSLLWNPLQKELIGIKNSLLKFTEFKNSNLLSLPAMKSFISFQDHPTLDYYDFSKNYIGDIKLPLKWELLGKGKQIDYYSDKFNKGDFWNYYHKFGEYDQNEPIVKDHKVMIYYDRKNNLIMIKGGKLTVTERGIIN